MMSIALVGMGVVAGYAVYCSDLFGLLRSLPDSNEDFDLHR